MFGSDHHSAFENWWQYASTNYVTWDGERAVGVDLYYDPVVDEHVGNGPMGLIAPTWYFAPQKREVARAGWEMAATFNSAFGDGRITGLDNPAGATMLLQVAGEFADPEIKARIWAAAEEYIEPSWEKERGEFTLGFGLDEEYPRGQWNARTMAGWVCTEGDWNRIFNEPNFSKFDEPTVTGVDFPRVALSEARWDGAALHLRAHPQNASVEGTTTKVRITNLPPAGGWAAVQADGTSTPLELVGEEMLAVLRVDNQPTVIRQS